MSTQKCAPVHTRLRVCISLYICAPALVHTSVRPRWCRCECERPTHTLTYSRIHAGTHCAHACNMRIRRQTCTHAHMHTCTASMCTANALVRHVDLGRVERMTAHAHKAWRWHAAHARQSRVPLTQALADVRAPHARVTFACGMACRMHAPRLIDDRSPFPTKPHLL